MKRAVALVALGTALLLSGAGCEGSTSAGRHGILLVGSAKYDKTRIFLWRPGSPAEPIGAMAYGISSPQWSPDGRSIAFSQDAGAQPGPSKIFLMRLDGTKVRLLTNRSRDALEPSWSPDGGQIVFQRYREASSEEQLVTVDASTGHERTLPGSFSIHPVWGKPGIAYLSSSGIMLMNPATGRLRRVWRGGYALAWSPDGVLALVEPARILLLAATGRVLGKFPLPPATRPGSVCAIAWSPNGKQILAASNDRNLELWVGTVGTKHWQRLPRVPVKGAYCSVSWR